MKIVTILGARPQFVKASVLSQKLKLIATEVIVHTGQHYDENMSGSFFKDLDIPKPDYYLHLGGMSHGQMTGRMIKKIEDVLFIEKPDIVLVYGDTNSTLAGALAAVKLKIPIAHIEAGLRDHDLTIPEEVNRVLTDRISKWNFTPTNKADINLDNEGLLKTVYNVGDVMYDALLRDVQKAKELYNNSPGEDNYILVTLHRPHNVDDYNNLVKILTELELLDKRVVFPMHPRTRSKIPERLINDLKIKIIEPQSRLSFVNLLKNCSAVVTDSGGVQKEAYWLNKPCVTVSHTSPWTETISDGWNILSKPEDIHKNMKIIMGSFKAKGDHYGDGRSAVKICSVLFDWFNNK